jgi:transcriptional regulator with XRE-family HTH domain
MEYGTILKQLRKSSGKSASEVARHCGVTANTIYNIEKGKADGSYGLVSSYLSCLGLSLVIVPDTSLELARKLKIGKSDT